MIVFFERKIRRRQMTLSSSLNWMGLFFLLLLAVFSCDESGNINTPEYFPDPNFRAAVEEYMGIESDGVFTAEQAAEKTEPFDCSRRFIENLTGIEYFTSLTHLNCSHNYQLRQLDLTKNKNLIGLNCSWSLLRTLDLSPNTELVNLDCSQNSLQTLDFSSNSELSRLYCQYNQLVDVNLLKNHLLSILYIGSNPLKELKLSPNAFLKQINAFDLPLTSVSGHVVYQCDFNRDGDMKGWKPNEQMTPPKVAYGRLQARATDEDPILTRSGLNLPAQNLRAVIVNLFTNQPSHAEIFFITKKNRFFKIGRRYFEGAGTKTIVFFLYKKFRKGEILKAIRIDPTYQPGAQFALYSIQLIASNANGAIPETDELNDVDSPQMETLKTHQYW